MKKKKRYADLSSYKIAHTKKNRSLFHLVSLFISATIRHRKRELVFISQLCIHNLDIFFL